MSTPEIWGRCSYKAAWGWKKPRARGVHQVTGAYTVCGLPVGNRASGWIKVSPDVPVACRRCLKRLTPQSLLDWFLKCTGNGCWEWPGSRRRSGYGIFHRDSHKIAHRFAWAHRNGPIPVGLDVCHTCDNPPCVNPAHLFLGTASDNGRDMVAKGRWKGHRLAGELCPTAKLTWEKVKQMRLMRSNGETYAVIAKHVGIHPNSVGRIVLFKGWKQNGSDLRDSRLLNVVDDAVGRLEGKL